MRCWDRNCRGPLLKRYLEEGRTPGGEVNHESCAPGYWCVWCGAFYIQYSTASVAEGLCLAESPEHGALPGRESIR